MKMVLLIIGLSFLVSISISDSKYPICYKMFQCSDNNDVFENKVCVSPKSHQTEGYRKFAIQLDQCNAHEKCDPSISTASSCITYSYKEKDEKCTANEECLSSNCEGGKCLSLNQGDECFADGDCPNTFFCGQVNSTLTFNCISQVVEGSKCYSDNDCLNNLGCLNNICTKYYSLKDNTPSSDPSFCLSGEIQIIDKQAKCTTLSAVQSDTTCKSDQTQCQYKNQAALTFTKDCTCSLSNLFTKYCPMASDKGDWKSTVSQLVTFYNGDALKKHTINRHRYPSTLSKKKYETFNYPQLIGADQCTVRLFTSSNKISISIALLLALIFLIY